MGSFLGKGQQHAAASSESYNSASQQRCSAHAYSLPEGSQEDSLFETKLPDELLAQVFEHLLPADLIKGPARVSQRWQRCCLQPCVWRCKLGLSGFRLEELSCTQRWALPQLYSVLGVRNLLEYANNRPRVMCGRIPGAKPWPGMPSWSELAGSQWSHEIRGGVGMPETLPEEIHPDDLVLASSYTICGVSRIIDLKAAFIQAGLQTETAEAVLDTQPVLHFSIWYGQRFDCGATGAIMVGFGRTADEAGKAISGHLHNLTVGDVTSREVEQTWTQDHVARVGLQGEHGKWKKYVCSIEALPPGTRFVHVTIQGKDTQFWRGHYGMKFVQPCLTWSTSKHCVDPCKCSAECLQAVFGRSGVTSAIWRPLSA